MGLEGTQGSVHHAILDLSYKLQSTNKAGRRRSSITWPQNGHPYSCFLSISQACSILLSPGTERLYECEGVMPDGCIQPDKDLVGIQ